MPKGSPSSASELKSALRELGDSLGDYRSTLEELYDRGTARPAQLAKKVKAALLAYERADVLLTDFRVEFVLDSFKKIAEERASREAFLERLRAGMMDLSQSPIRTVFYGACFSLAGVMDLIPTVLRLNISSAVGETLSLPPVLERFSARQRRAGWWAVVGFVMLGTSFLFNVPIGWGVALAVVGLVVFMLERLYVSQVIFPGAGLPAKLAEEASRQARLLGARIDAVHSIAARAGAVTLSWPDLLNETLRKLDAGEHVSDEELVDQAEFANALYEKVSPTLERLQEGARLER